MLSRSAEELIPKLRECMSSQPIEKAWLFGSYSKGEENKDSDVDILVKYDEHTSLSLFGISKIILDIEKSINKKVDLVEEGCLLPFAVQSVEKDKVLIYERKN